MFTTGTLVAIYDLQEEGIVWWPRNLLGQAPDSQEQQRIRAACIGTGPPVENGRHKTLFYPRNQGTLHMLWRAEGASGLALVLCLTSQTSRPANS